MKDVGAGPEGRATRTSRTKIFGEHVDPRGADAQGGHGVHGPGQAPRPSRRPRAASSRSSGGSRRPARSRSPRRCGRRGRAGRVARVAENRIIARATAAGTRRLRAVPLGRRSRARPRRRPRRDRAAEPPAHRPERVPEPPPSARAPRWSRWRASRPRPSPQHAREQGFEPATPRAGAGRARVADLLQLAERPSARSSTPARGCSRSPRRRLVELALQIAEKILQRARSRPSRERVVDVLRGALRKAFVRDRLTVVCNPDDLGADRGRRGRARRRRSATLKDLRADRRPARPARRRGRARRRPATSTRRSTPSSSGLRAAMLGEDARD